MEDHFPANPSDSREAVLDQCIESFTANLSELGYSPVVVRTKRSMVSRFARWVERRRTDAVTIDETTVSAFLAYLKRRKVPIGNWRCTLIGFLEHLRGEGTTVRPEPVHDDSPAALLLQRYARYLREERGLASETACHYQRFADEFVREHLAVAATGVLAADPGLQEVQDHLLARVRTLAPRTAQLVATALRSFLRFLFLQGETAADLTAAVPSVHRWRPGNVHAYLQPEEVEQLLAACDSTKPRGRREPAVLLLLARLGMRSREVAALEIGDLRWRAGEILVRGKGQVHQCLPMLPDVGAALALYLQRGRPKSTSP